MKIGVNLSIDVTKLDKARFYKGQKGTYANLTAFVDTENKSEYGDNGMITESTSKEEREQGVKGKPVGNVKVFYKDYAEKPPAPDQPQQNDDDFGDLPF